MHFRVKKIIVDPGVKLTPLPKSRKYELNSIKRAWVECELEDGNSKHEVKLIIDGVSRGRLFTVIVKDCPITSMGVVKQLAVRFLKALHVPTLAPFDISDERTICSLRVSEDDVLGLLHKIKEIGGFKIKL